MKFFLAILLFFSAVSAAVGDAVNKTIVDTLIANPETRYLVELLGAADLISTLSSAGPFTIFAPTNKAIGASTLGVLTEPTSKEYLVKLLTYHVVPGSQTSLQNKENLTTVEGDIVTVVKLQSSMFINDAHVASVDVTPSNGVIYIVDRVLTLPEHNEGKTIVDVVVSNPALDVLTTALEAGDLINTLLGPGPFTLFAPNDAAFSLLPDGALNDLLKPANKAELVDLLTYHVVSGAFSIADFKQDGQYLQTVEGKNLLIRLSGDDVFINDALVVTNGQKVSNGVVHVIDSLLLPASAPSKTNSLFFYAINPKPDDGSEGPRCGEVDAAPRMPDALFLPENKAALQAYVNTTLAFYKPAFAGSNLQLGRCQFTAGFNKYVGQETNVVWAPDDLMNFICKVQCQCSFDGKNADLPKCSDDIKPDDPDTQHWCSLCGPKFNDPITVDFYVRA